MLEILQGSSSSSTVRKYAFLPIDGEKVPLVLPPPLPEIGTALALFLNLAVDRPLHTETKDDPQIAKRSSSVIRKNKKKLIKKINK